MLDVEEVLLLFADCPRACVGIPVTMGVVSTVGMFGHTNRGHTGLYAFSLYFAKTVQPSIPFDRQVEFVHVRTTRAVGILLLLGQSVRNCPGSATAPRFELTSKFQKGTRFRFEPPGRSVLPRVAQVFQELLSWSPTHTHEVKQSRLREIIL